MADSKTRPPRAHIIHRILRHGTSSDRQISTFYTTNDPKAVVDQLIRETMEGVL